MMSIQGIFRCTHRRLLAGLVTFVSLTASHSVLALTISLNGINGFSQISDPQAWGGYVTAAARFESAFDDPVTVNLDVGFEPLGGALGSTGVVTNGFFYSNVKTALTTDGQSADDLTAVTNLPVGPNLSFLINDPTTVTPTTRVIDNNNSANNRVLDVNKANAKALGLTGPDATKDAEIILGDSFSYDFDPGDGISPGEFDFVGIVTHEIGHALGFISGVDIVDITSGAGPSAPENLDPFRVFSVWDLYRFTSESLLAGVDFDFATGGSAYFSIDGGATNLGTFSTGDFNGDGNQASHWKDNLGLGIMDPTLAAGQLDVVTALDLTAFDVMGWDLAAAAVPVPAAIWLFGSGLVGFAALGRRHRNLRISS